MENNYFPKGFVWGCATAAYQFEGAYDQDGRGLSTWDVFSHKPGNIHNNDTADRATDHYNRFSEDVGLMKDLGINAYRFSISWPRIFPKGFGSCNQKGIDFYNRLVDKLLEAGIAPWVTLFHWDLPQYLQEHYCGWLSREVPLFFSDYALFVAEQLSDRVKNFMTINEFKNFTDQAYGKGILAPGLKLEEGQIYTIRHNAMLGHGLAASKLKDKLGSKINVGIAESIQCCVPVYQNKDNIDAAMKACRNESFFLRTILEKEYPEAYLRKATGFLPDNYEKDLETIGTNLDFIGINIYSPVHILADDNEESGYRIVPLTESYPKMQSPWAHIDPQIAYWMPRFLKEIWDVDQIFITENGCAAKDKLNERGEVLDTDRVMFIRSHLLSLNQAIQEGYPVKGYFLWSLMDNFEWIRGYSHRFGLYFVDYDNDLKRIPKLSADFYKEIVKSNKIR
jgi:beta-glucosidase